MYTLTVVCNKGYSFLGTQGKLSDLRSEFILIKHQIIHDNNFLSIYKVFVLAEPTVFGTLTPKHTRD